MLVLVPVLDVRVLVVGGDRMQMLVLVQLQEVVVVALVTPGRPNMLYLPALQWQGEVQWLRSPAPNEMLFFAEGRYERYCTHEID